MALDELTMMGAELTPSAPRQPARTVATASPPCAPTPGISSGMVGASTRIATQWVIDRCKTPLEDVLRNNLALFQATVHYARTLPTCKDV